ncbi:type II/III secretion system protein [Legionella geestiana]|uniref:type II/III secretion system protein n=1 Tax=Legionella geestiana TaxID=45065 RepID=UPI0010929B18|nr:type II/III secretion system protein [Legionella geestiana]QDQ39807.1 type II/III secretion system protein [Legionella geestiana]
MKKVWLLMALLLTGTAFAEDEGNISKVISLQYQDASVIIPLVKPLLQPGDKISGSGQTLVVNVSPQTLTSLRAVLHQVDVPPVTFEIAIHQDTPQWLSQVSNTVVYGSNSQQIQLNNQSVRVMNGQSAFVSTSQNVPVIQSAGIGWWTGVDYARMNVQNGVFLLPKLQGQQVQLQVRRARDEQQPANQQQFTNQNVDTTLMVPLDTWYSLGSAEGSNSANPTGNAAVYSAGAQYGDNSTLYVRIHIVGQ